jgi:Skp family chaperone for outer membrane proteins
MKRYLLSILLISITIIQVKAQSKGVKIGYIDMEYILQNVPDYSEAKSQLEQKAQIWKQEIEEKKIEIAKLKDELKTEKALLTKELIEEREEEIKFQEGELLDFQQKKFGPNGDLITQKAVLVKPIQDQVFTAVQDIAEAKKYDFVFDKSSDLTMLFSAKRYDISDQVIRVISRAERREQMSKKEIKAQEAKEALEDTANEVNPDLEARKKLLEEKKKAREQEIADKKAAVIAKKAEQEAKRAEILAAKNAKKNGTVPANNTTDENKSPANTEEENKKSSDSSKVDIKAIKAAERAKLIEERKIESEKKRQKLIEDRKIESDNRKKKLLEDKEAAQKAREELKNKTKTE